MRVAILLKKAELEGSELQEDVAFFIAKNLRSNVRELEGALRKVLAFASFHARPITVDLAREALKDLLQASTGQITVELIQRTVADYYKIRVSDMHSKKRSRAVARPPRFAGRSALTTTMNGSRTRYRNDDHQSSTAQTMPIAMPPANPITVSLNVVQMCTSSVPSRIMLMKVRTTADG